MKKNAPTAEVISVGTELLLGQIVDTNAVYLSRELCGIGINVYHRQTVGDNLDRLTNAILLAKERSDLVFLIGGLGPTEDDLTRDALARALGLPLLQDAEAARQIRAYFERAGRRMTENNLRQALCPQGGECLYNFRGTAPGIFVKTQDKCFFLLPGPPSECEPMIAEGVLPRLKERFVSEPLYSRTLRLFGIGESALADILGKDFFAQVDPTVAPYAKEGEVTLRLTARGEECAAIEKICRRIASLPESVRPFVYTCEYDSLAETLVRRFKAAGLTFCTAESCTGGLVAEMVTGVSGASDVLLGGGVTYTEAVKMRLCGVKAETLSQYSAVSCECAVEMAQGAQALFGADVSVSITGFAGPTGGTDADPVGTVYFGVAYRDRVSVERRVFSGSRQQVRHRAALTALALSLQAAGLFQEAF